MSEISERQSTYDSIFTKGEAYILCKLRKNESIDLTIYPRNKKLLPINVINDDKWIVGTKSAAIHTWGTPIPSSLAIDINEGIIYKKNKWFEYATYMSFKEDIVEMVNRKDQPCTYTIHSEVERKNNETIMIGNVPPSRHFNTSQNSYYLEVRSFSLSIYKKIETEYMLETSIYLKSINIQNILIGMDITSSSSIMNHNYENIILLDLEKWALYETDENGSLCLLNQFKDEYFYSTFNNTIIHPLNNVYGYMKDIYFLPMYIQNYSSIPSSAVIVRLNNERIEFLKNNAEDMISELNHWLPPNIEMFFYGYGEIDESEMDVNNKYKWCYIDLLNWNVYHYDPITQYIETKNFYDDKRIIIFTLGHISERNNYDNMPEGTLRVQIDSHACLVYENISQQYWYIGNALDYLEEVDDEHPLYNALQKTRQTNIPFITAYGVDKKRAIIYTLDKTRAVSLRNVMKNVKDIHYTLTPPKENENMMIIEP